MCNTGPIDYCITDCPLYEKECWGDYEDTASLRAQGRIAECFRCLPEAEKNAYWAKNPPRVLDVTGECGPEGPSVDIEEGPAITRRPLCQQVPPYEVAVMTGAVGHRGTGGPWVHPLDK